MSLEFEIVEDDRLIPIENSHLMWGQCSCGARALVAPGRTPRCSVCALAGAVHIAPPPVDGLPKLGEGFHPRPAEPREAFPRPLVTSRDPWDGAGAPSPVVKLAQKAVEASWRVRVQRSRGCAPHAATGRAGAVKWRFAVRLRTADGLRGAYAVYDADGSTWKSVMLWGADLPWFPLASVTDLAEYIEAGGVMPREWCDGIRKRHEDAAKRAEQRKLCDRGLHPPIPIALIVTCPACGNSWAFGEEPWKKPRRGKGEAL